MTPPAVQEDRGKILVLDGMWNKALAAVRCLGRRGLYIGVGEKTRLAAALFSRYSARRFVHPSPVHREKDFLAALEKELMIGGYEVVLPMELSTQMVLTANRERLSAHTRIPFADPETTAKVHDKAFLMGFAGENGFDIPKTYLVEDLAGLRDIAAKTELPAVIKPRGSSGSRGIVYVGEREKLIDSYLAVHAKYAFPLIQEYIPPGGGAYGVGLLLNFSSEVRASFVYRRVREYPISGGPSTVRESCRREDVRTIAESLLKALGWTGVAHVEFKVDPRDGRPKLLEVNPRFWGSLHLAVEAGIDFPYLLYRMAMDGDVDPVFDYEEGVRCRWLIPGDLLHFLKNPERFRMEPSFFDFGIKDDILSIKDPLPVFGRVLSGLSLLYDQEMRNLLSR